MGGGHRVRRVIPRDAIPSVDDPAFREAHPDPDEQVVGVVVDGDARAYPVRYLDFHEVVNDAVGGVPVAVTWCPLCGSAVVYDRRPAAGTLPDGVDAADSPETLAFGVSGKLADDDLVLYDRETGSEWKQSLGEAIAGDLAGARLRVLPATATTWSTFRDANDGAVVLAPPGGESEAAGDGDDPEPIDYDAGPYDRYVESPGFGLDAHRGGDGREWHREDVDPKAVVLGVERDGDAVGFPLLVVEDAGGVVTATVGEESVVVFAADGVHAFRDPGWDWEPARGGFRADGVLWDGATGDPLDNPATHVAANRESLERLPARRLFAFAWADDHGDDAFYGLD